LLQQKLSSLRDSDTGGINLLHFGGEAMGNLGTLGIFFAGFFGGLGVFLAACGLLWWCSLYQKINLPKQKKNQ
jgi:hypothetical protein